MVGLEQHQVGRRWCGTVGAVALTIGLAVAGATAARADTPAHSAGRRTRAVAQINTTPASGTYTALTPSRIADTRTGVGRPVPAHGVLTVQADGRGGVPASGVAAVVVQVTSTAQTAAGFVTVYPSLVSPPLASNLDFVAHVDTSNLVTVPVGSDGKIELRNGSNGSNQLIVDVQGYFRGGAATTPGAFRSLTPSRILDTRVTSGGAGPVAPLRSVDLQVTGRGGIPASGVGAVAVNLTVTAPSKAGYVTASPFGPTRPTVSNVNFVAGQTVPNLVIVPVGSGGKISLFNGSAGNIQLIADVQGYFLAGSTTATGGFRPLAPTRILDTRSGLGGSHRAAASAETKLHIEGHGGVPASGVSAVVLNVTGVDPSAAGSLVAFPTGVRTPLASNLNFTRGGTRANLVIVPVDAFGWISLTNDSTGSVDEIADVAGYFLGGGVNPTVLGPYTYGPFTMGMTIAAAKAVYPALDPTYSSPSACGDADLPQAGLVFNHGTGVLSFISADIPVQTGNGIHYGDTFASVIARFPSADISPDEPPMELVVNAAEQSKPRPTTYWFQTKGPRDPITDLPRTSDTISGISLAQNELCFD